MSTTQTRVIILAAGYGTRLHKDVDEYLQQNKQKSVSSEYSLVNSLQNLPKPLLPLAKKPLVSHWLDSLRNEHICTANQIYLVTNSQYYSQFANWAAQNGIPEQNILDNGTETNETRLGAIMDLKLMLEHVKRVDETYDDETDGFIVLGGDTLFDRRFHLEAVQKEMGKWDLLVLSYQLSDTEKVNEKGIIELSEENLSTTPESGRVVRKITRFLEKPSEDETKSRTASPCFYALPRRAHYLLSRYLDTVGDGDDKESLSKRDAPGHFVKYMVEHTNVGALAIEQRFDVGRLDQFFEANDYFTGEGKS